MIRSLSRHHWVVFGLAFAGEFSNSLAPQSIAPLAPLFQPELGLSRAEVGLFSTAMFAGAWGVLLITGSLADRFGVRKVLSLGEISVGALMICMSLVGSFLQAVAVLLAVGVGRAATGTTPPKVVLEWFPARIRGTVMGMMQTGMPMSGILAASILPAVGVMWGWRSALALTGCLIVVVGLITALLYRAPAHSEDPARRGWNMRASLGQVVGNSYLWRLSTMNLLLVTAQFCMITYLALYFHEVVLVPWVPDEGGRIVAAGGYLALCQVGGAIGRPFWGVASDRMLRGRRTVVIAVVGFLTVPLYVASGFLASFPLWLVTAIVFGLGITAVGWSATYQVLLTETVGRKYAATAVGFNMTVSAAGKVIGPPLFGLLVDVTGTYTVAWIFIAVIAAIGTAMAVLNIKGEKRPA